MTFKGCNLVFFFSHALSIKLHTVLCESFKNNNDQVSISCIDEYIYTIQREVQNHAQCGLSMVCLTSLKSKKQELSKFDPKLHACISSV